MLAPGVAAALSQINPLYIQTSTGIQNSITQHNNGIMGMDNAAAVAMLAAAVGNDDVDDESMSSSPGTDDFVDDGNTDQIQQSPVESV